MRRLLAPLAVASAVAILAWWGLHLAIELDALAADRAFTTSGVRRCDLDRESVYFSHYVERC